MPTTTTESTIANAGPATPAASGALLPVQTVVPAPATPRTGLLRLLPSPEVLRFLIVGVANTLWSYILYVGFGYLFTHMFPHGNQVWISEAAFIISWPIAVSGSFLGFKHFVFKTKGNYLKEWIRCIAVYSVTIPASLIIVPGATKLFLLTPIPTDWAKYPAGIVNSAIIALYSYFGHKKFSFKK